MVTRLAPRVPNQLCDRATSPSTNVLKVAAIPSADTLADNVADSLTEEQLDDGVAEKQRLSEAPSTMCWRRKDVMLPWERGPHGWSTVAVVASQAAGWSLVRDDGPYSF